MPGVVTGPSPTLWTWTQQLCELPMPGRVRGRGSLRGAVLWETLQCWVLQTRTDGAAVQAARATL